MTRSVREPFAAGSYYPGTPTALSAQLAWLFGEEVTVADRPFATSAGLVVPHAGYPFSGPVAAVGYRRLASWGQPPWAIILGTNHTGMGRPISLAREGIWRTPLGEVPISTEIADRLVAKGLEVSPSAFQREHSIELQLPFLQHLFSSAVPFVPVCVMLPPLSQLEAAGEAIAEVIADQAGLILASGDFTHYKPDTIARQIDQWAIDRIVELDVEGFYRRLVEEHLTICGGGPIAILMIIARRLGWSRPQLLSYQTSGDVTGDRSAVVGYAAIAFPGRTCG